MTPALDTLFGSRAAAATLLFLARYESGHASEISRIMQLPITPIRAQLVKFERAGLLVSHLVGRSRTFRFNNRSPLADRLQSLLHYEIESLPEEIVEKYFQKRRRPRRVGKTLVAL